MGALDWYRKQWPKLSGVGAGVVAATLAYRGAGMSRPRALALASFGTLLAHQFEEYVKPGTFPGLLNAEMLGSDQPINYPANTHSTMIVNVALGYPYMLLPVVLPHAKAIGLAQALFGFEEAAAHTVLFPIKSGRRTSPGQLTAVLLWVPLGIAWIVDQRRNHGGLSRRDVRLAVASSLLFGVVGIGAPIRRWADRDSPYAFSPRQVER